MPLLLPNRGCSGVTRFLISRRWVICHRPGMPWHMAYGTSAPKPPLPQSHLFCNHRLLPTTPAVPVAARADTSTGLWRVVLASRQHSAGAELFPLHEPLRPSALPSPHRAHQGATGLCPLGRQQWLLCGRGSVESRPHPARLPRPTGRGQLLAGPAARRWVNARERVIC